MLEEVRLSVCSNDIATNIRGVSREDEDTSVNKEEVTVLVKHMRFPSISSDHQLHGPEEANNWGEGGSGSAESWRWEELKRWVEERGAVAGKGNDISGR